MPDHVVNVQVQFHRESPNANCNFIMPLQVDIPDDDVGNISAPFNIDELMEFAQEQVKALLRPFLNNQTYIDTDTPAIPMRVNV